MAEKKGNLPDAAAAGAVANAAQYLKGLRFPAGKADIERQARENGMDTSALAQIRYLPDREYHDPGEVFKALGDEVRGL